MTREFAHGLSVTKPTTSRATVLLTPIMEIRRAPWVLSSLRSFARSGKKLNGMKNPETEVNRYIHVACICGTILVKEKINILMLLIWRYETSNGHNRIIVLFKSFLLILCLNLFHFLKPLASYDETTDHI